MRWTVSIWSGCLEDTYPDDTILHNRTNDLKSYSTPDEIADKILNLAGPVKTTEIIFFSGPVVRNNKLKKKGTEVNELLMGKCGTRQLLFIDNKNFN